MILSKVTKQCLSQLRMSKENGVRRGRGGNLAAFRCGCHPRGLTAN